MTKLLYILQPSSGSTAHHKPLSSFPWFPEHCPLPVSLQPVALVPQFLFWSLHLLSTSPSLTSPLLPSLSPVIPSFPSSPLLSSRSSHLLSFCYGLDLKGPHSLHIDPQLPVHFREVVGTFRNKLVRVDPYCYVIPGTSTSLFPAN